MKIMKSKYGYFVVLRKGEHLVESLTQLAKDRGLVAASVTGIGAVKNVELGYFDLPEKRYDRRMMRGDYELLSLTGNLTSLEGQPVPHCHVVLGDKDYSCLGGHLFEAEVAVTAEIVITVLGNEYQRETDEDTGLCLIVRGDK